MLDSLCGIFGCILICFVSIDIICSYFDETLDVVENLRLLEHWTQALSFSSVVLSVFLGSLLFLLIIYLFRNDRKISVYGRLDRYPHKVIFSFLQCIKSYDPPVWLFNRHLETIISTLISPKLPFELEQEIVHVYSKEEHLHDGKCGLDWAPIPPKFGIGKNTSDEKQNARNKAKLASIPIVVIVAGLTGDSRASYAGHILLKCYENGWQGCVFHARSRGGVQLETPQAYNVGYTEDLRQCIEYIHKKYPQRPIFAIGFSLGSNYLCKLVGEDKEKCLLTGLSIFVLKTKRKKKEVFLNLNILAQRYFFMFLFIFFTLRV